MFVRCLDVENGREEHPAPACPFFERANQSLLRPLTHRHNIQFGANRYEQEAASSRSSDNQNVKLNVARVLGDDDYNYYE